MIKILTLCVVASAIATLLVWSYVSGRHVSFSEQWPLYEALRTTASIIFAVVGAWLAIIYPERLKYAFRNPPNNTPKQQTNMGRLLSPAIHSTAILCVVLIVGVVAPLMVQTTYLIRWHTELRGASYVLLVLLTLWQLGTIILTLIPADQIKTNSDKDDLHRRTEDGYFRNTQKVDPTDITTNK